MIVNSYKSYFSYDTLAEWLRRSTRNRLGLSRVGSSPASVVIPFCLLHRIDFCLTKQQIHAFATDDGDDGGDDIHGNKQCDYRSVYHVYRLYIGAAIGCLFYILQSMQNLVHALHLCVSLSLFPFHHVQQLPRHRLLLLHIHMQAVTLGLHLSRHI
jgi:hypothetical protein